jgi:hypothetical protein
MPITANFQCEPKSEVGVPPDRLVWSNTEHVSGPEVQRDDEYDQRRNNREHTSGEALKKYQCPAHDSILRLGRAGGTIYLRGCGSRVPPRASVNHPSVPPLKLAGDGSGQQVTAAVGRRKQLKTLKTGPIHLVWPIIQEDVWFSGRFILHPPVNA